MARWAWQGRAIRNLNVAGIASVETAGEPLDDAASGFDEFLRTTHDRLTALEAAVADLSEAQRAAGPEAAP